jgi:hypothetical protein
MLNCSKIFEDLSDDSQNLRLAIVIANSDYGNPSNSIERKYGDLP